MGYEQSFTVTLDEYTACKRVIRYYNLAGYELLFNADTVLKFERHSLKGLYPSSSPIRTYKVKVLIIPEGEKSKIVVDTESEYSESYWADPYIIQEIKNLEVFLLKNEFVPTVVNDAKKKIAFSLLGYYSKSFVRKLSLWLLVSVIAGIVAGVLAEKFIDDRRLALITGFLICLLTLFFIRGIWHKWKKRNTRDITS
jgi:hypothetical protein